ncbi:hypothetical protein [Bacillus sp. ISL-55]|uniref:hypothetical protein n=1 Tax=Bacillus sp. ISL-55 TaxID=2819134 RepID=UPI001BE6553F|nr:hypothetical protein [Bacillus sp. ISL-55]MBT2694774.1 hypothetical protein [Bacillus sp. ISL-55]
MKKKSNEADFYKIKVAAYDRLHPDSISVWFWASLVLSAIMILIPNYVLKESGFDGSPFLIMTVDIAKILLFVQLGFAIFFTLESIAYSLQKLQSIIVSVVVIKVSLDMYVFYFTVTETTFGTPEYLTNTGLILMAGGFVFLAISTIRAIKRVKQGELRKEGKGLYNFQASKGYVSLPILFAATMIVGAYVRSFSDAADSFGMFLILLLCVVLQYGIAMAWPEFLLLTYCKYKFESFIVPRRKRRK